MLVDPDFAPPTEGSQFLIKDLSGAQVEEYICSRFVPGESFYHNGEKLTVLKSCKPFPVKKGGEGKTDVYVSLKDGANNLREIKISIKKHNAGHWENKISTERFQQIFGENINRAQKELYDLIKVIENNRTPFDDLNKGSITLGYRIDVVGKKRKLTSRMKPSKEVQMEILSGSHLDKNKRDSLVDGGIVPYSGVATHILELHKDDQELTPSMILNRAVPIEEFVDSGRCEMFFAAAAVNNRWSENSQSFKNENRPVLAYYLFKVKDNKLTYELVPSFDLKVKTKQVFDNWNDRVHEQVARMRKEAQKAYK